MTPRQTIDAHNAEIERLIAAIRAKAEKFDAMNAAQNNPGSWYAVGDLGRIVMDLKRAAGEEE